MASSDSHKRACAKYDAHNTVQYHLKLNKKTDADIIKRLKRVDSMQGYIKALIRDDINRDLYDIDERVEY